MKRNNLIINLGLVFLLPFGMAFACGDRGGTRAEDPQSNSTVSDSGPPTEQVIKDSFIKQYEGRDITFEKIQIGSNQSSFRSNLGVNVHGYPVKVDYTLRGEGYGYQNGERETGGIYYYYRNEFGDWESFTDTIPKETKF